MEKTLSFNGISMKFGDFYANKEISFEIKKNEIHALLGENGAGKSTLMSVLFGLYNQTSGTIKMDGKMIKINNPKDASNQGISMLPQHFKLVDNMNAWENIIIGSEITYGKILISKSKAISKIKEAQKKYNIKLDLNKKISKLSTSEKQKVELLKMLWKDSEILIFDEPTSILTPQEIDQFLKMILDLKKKGKTVLLITHKLEEIRQVADRCSILRKGKYINTVSGKTSAIKLAELMIGKEIDLNLSSIKKTVVKSPKEILSVHELIHKGETLSSSLKNVSFSINEGEILGIAAIDGNGQSELFKLISGLDKTNKGDIKVLQESILKNNVYKRYFNSDLNIMGHIPEDRHLHGLFLDRTPRMNSIMQNIDEFKGILGILNKNKIGKYFSNIEKKFDVRGVRDKNTKTRALSGGNQQKLIVGREIARKPKLLLAAHPTRGLDMGAIRNVFSEIISLRNSGSSILLYSGELDEIIQVSDRIIVLNNGKVTGEFKGKFDKKKIGHLMLDNGGTNGKK